MGEVVRCDFCSLIVLVGVGILSGGRVRGGELTGEGLVESEESGRFGDLDKEILKRRRFRPEFSVNSVDTILMTPLTPPVDDSLPHPLENVVRPFRVDSAQIARSSSHFAQRLTRDAAE